MERIYPNQILALADAAEPPCVSIYLPTHRAGRDTQGDPVLLKNLLADAERQLIERGMRPAEARKLLEQARPLLDDADFWVHSSEALALFLAQGFFRHYRLPIQTDDMAVVNDRFHTKPLLPLLGRRLFHVLAVSLNDARLLECSPVSVHRLALPKDVATSFSEARGGKDHHIDRGLWRHGGGTRAQAQIGDVHGHGPDQDNEMRENLLFYMRQLDDGVRRAVGEQLPLIVAGVNSTTPYFMQATKHHKVIPEPLDGNFEHESDEKLRELGMAVMAPRWRRELEQVGERFGTAQAQGIGSDDVAEIVRAAGEGRVDTLIVSPAAAVWGDFDEEQNLARVRDGGPEDLIDLAVHRTLRADGNVVVADEGTMPGRREAAAIYRY